MIRLIQITATIVSLVLLLAPCSVMAQDKFVEDFTTNTYEDFSSTGAEWSTDDGEIRLYPFVTSLIGVADTPGNAARKVTLNGDYAYVSDGYAGIQIIDISDTEAPVLAATHNTPGYAYEVQVEGRYAYVADHSGDLRVLDISDPVAPVTKTSLHFGGVALGIDVDGNYAYIGAGDGGVVVVDITDPLAPFIAGIHTVASGGPRSIDVAGDYAFITLGDEGMLVMDISDPAGPYTTYTYASQGFTEDLEISGNYVYLATSNSGLEVVDISDPTQPFLAGLSSTTGEVRGLHIAGDRAYVANGVNGLRLINISDPTSPILEEVINTSGHAYDVIGDGLHAFVADFGAGLKIIQVAQSFSPIHRGHLDGYISGEPAIAGNYAYVAGLSSGVMVMDVSSPDNPVNLGSFSTPGYARGLCISGNLVLVADSAVGLTIMDISEPTQLVFLGGVELVENAWAVTVSGNYAYVAAENFLITVDISDPSVPVVVGSLIMSDAITHIEVVGNIGFLYQKFRAFLEIVDLSDPTSPVHLSTFFGPDDINDIHVRGNLVFVAGGEVPLLVVDISDPYNPVEFSRWYFSGWNSRAIEVVGDRAFLAFSNGDLFALNISNPANIRFQNWQYTGYSYRYLLAMGDMMLASSGNSGGSVDILQVFQHDWDMTRRHVYSTNIATNTDPLYRVRVNSAHTGIVSWDVYVDGGYAAFNAMENQWYQADYPGTNLVWAAKLDYDPTSNSVASELTIEWLYEHPLIESIADIPNDQGGQVRVSWVRSGHDFTDDANQIAEYAIYRQIDGDLASKTAGALEMSGASASLQENAQTMLAAGWDYVTSLPVLVEDHYAVVVPTLADSTLVDGVYESVFKVVALTATPGVFYSSHPDSGSSVDNLAPGVPMSIVASYGADTVEMAWDESADDDFQYFRIYRDTDPGFIPGEANLVYQVATPAWIDAVNSAWQYHYKITAVDFSGNESMAGVVAGATDAPQTGSVFALHGAVPNPFNPSTQISYSLAETGKVQLAVYDVAGRLVRTLVDEVLPAGEHKVRWDGHNQAGQLVASGAYFTLLRSAGTVERQRMMLMK